MDSREIGIYIEEIGINIRANTADSREIGIYIEEIAIN